MWQNFFSLKLVLTIMCYCSVFLCNIRHLVQNIRKVCSLYTTKPTSISNIWNIHQYVRKCLNRGSKTKLISYVFLKSFSLQAEFCKKKKKTLIFCSFKQPSAISLCRIRSCAGERWKAIDIFFLLFGANLKCFIIQWLAKWQLWLGSTLRHHGVHSAIKVCTHFFFLSAVIFYKYVC